MQPTQSPGEYIAEAGKMAPPAAVTGISLLGVSLQDWTYILTITYTLLLIARWVWKAVKDYRGR